MVRRLRRPLVSPFVLAILSIGCGIDDEQFTIAVCDTDDFDLVRQIAPAEPVDYLELRRFLPGGQWTTLESDGSACMGATDQSACTTALDALPESWVSAGDLGLAYTRGDEVYVFNVIDRYGLLATSVETRDFVGAIDAPGDAALAVLDPRRPLPPPPHPRSAAAPGIRRSS